MSHAPDVTLQDRVQVIQLLIECGCYAIAAAAYREIPVEHQNDPNIHKFGEVLREKLAMRRSIK